MAQTAAVTAAKAGRLSAAVPSGTSGGALGSESSGALDALGAATGELAAGGGAVAGPPGVQAARETVRTAATATIPVVLRGDPRNDEREAR